MVELSTRINCFFSVYRPSKLISEVRMVVSFLSALKKRATIPPKPQSVSSERTAKGKASRFLDGLVESLTATLGSLIVKGTNSFLPGMVSGGISCQAKEGAVLIKINKKTRHALIIYLGVVLLSAHKIRPTLVPQYYFLEN